METFSLNFVFEANFPGLRVRGDRERSIGKFGAAFGLRRTPKPTAVRVRPKMSQEFAGKFLGPKIERSVHLEYQFVIDAQRKSGFVW